MPTNQASMQARFTEIADVACCQKTLQQLHGMTCGPSTKQFVRQREARRALWVQLYETAQAQMAALSVPVEGRRRTTPAKPRVTTEVGHFKGGPSHNIQTPPKDTPGFVTDNASEPLKNNT